ncbi:MAG: transposase [Candidatus Aminicenantes bacterium]|nr:transposase [Candidatus Aminicenantes bacterium]
MSNKNTKRYTPRFKFQVVMETLRSTKPIGQIAKAYGVHPITIHKWKREFIEKGPELFGQKTTIHEYEKKMRDLERLIGQKEVEIALLKNFLAGASPERRR